MKKGFTLLELLGIIILLGVIILVAVPSLIQSNKNAEINDKKEFNNTINSACLMYLQVHTDVNDEILNSSPAKSITIKANTLIEEGYLKGALKNPDGKTLEEEDGKITATKTSGQITCTYSK